MNFLRWLFDRCLSDFQSQKRTSQNEKPSDRMCTWVPASANRRKHRISEQLAALPFFFGSMLDDNDLQMQLLASVGDAFLIVCPRHGENEPSNTFKRWLLVFLANNETVIKINIIYSRGKFRLTKEPDVSLQQFMEEQELHTIPRPLILTSNQIADQMPITPRLPFPIPKGVFRLGSLSQKTLQIDAERRIPVFELDCTFLQPQLKQTIYDEAKKMLSFGSIHIWRLWGVVYESACLKLVLEDIVYGSLAEYTRLAYRHESQLKRFSLQMAEGLRYMEKFEFVHHLLSIDSFLVTYSYNVKLAIYGLSETDLIPKEAELDDIDRCRWMPPETLPAIAPPSILAPTDRSPYSLTSMVYTFGICLWSTFHGGKLPYEDQPPDNIRNRLYRIENPPESNEEYMPKEIIEVCIRCWEPKPQHRPRFKEIKGTLRKIQNTFHF